MKTAKTIAKLYSRTELTAALCDAVANRQASEQARQDAEAALADVRARLRDLRDQWQQLGTFGNGASSDTYAFCAGELTALLVDPPAVKILNENDTLSPAGSQG